MRLCRRRGFLLRRESGLCMGNKIVEYYRRMRKSANEITALYILG